MLFSLFLYYGLQRLRRRSRPFNSPDEYVLVHETAAACCCSCNVIAASTYAVINLFATAACTV